MAHVSSHAREQQVGSTLQTSVQHSTSSHAGRKLGSAQGRLRRSLAEKREPQAMLEDLWLAAYSRMPSQDEAQRVLAVVPAGDAKAALAAWEDIYWSVLNSKEFLFQH